MIFYLFFNFKKDSMILKEVKTLNSKGNDFKYPLQRSSLVCSDDKECAWNEREVGSIPGSVRSPREANEYPFQYSCLENSMDRGASWATIDGVIKSWTWLSNFHFHFLKVFVNHQEYAYQVWRPLFWRVQISIPLLPLFCFLTLPLFCQQGASSLSRVSSILCLGHLDQGSVWQRVMSVG